MKAKDLRIGNYIDYKTEREIVTMQISYEYIRLIHNGNKNFKPIELTEEWLLKFGFEKSDNEFYTETFKGDNKSDYYFCIRINDNLCDLVICERVDEINNYDLIVPKYIQHVHQLQNLYFALTGEELTL